MDIQAMETPVRKRRRSTTPVSVSSASRHVNKRFRSNSLASPSPKNVRFSTMTLEEEQDTVMELAIPESPISQNETVELVSFAPVPPLTPTVEINNPFAKLNLKASAQKKVMNTPIASKSGTDAVKSVKKSARKTPGSGRANKVLPFLIKSSSTSLTEHTLKVVPISTFSRYLFPILWLVGSTPRVFTAHRVPIIQTTNGEGMVMVAKVEGEKNLVVIEKIGECLYSMCTLKKDLKIKDIRTVAKTARDMDQTNQAPDGDSMQVDGDEWWRRMIVRHPQRREEQELSLNFLIGDGTAEPSTDKDFSMDTSEAVSFKRYDSEFSADSGYVSSPQDPLSQATTSITSQYLEALYSTKTSLAYFAKSALSRARSEFQRVRSSSDSQSLASFLQDMVLKEEDLNSKYETFLPSLIGDEMETAPWTITDEERNHLIQKFRRNGGEEHEINQTTLQREINELKIRELQLQIIILAESLALHEECKEEQDLLDDQKREDSEMLLSSHLDRLSISGMLESDNDFSEQFMREILLPFYGSRIPKILEMVGGPMDFTSPVKSNRKPLAKPLSRQSILSPNTLDRIARPRRHDLSPTPFPAFTSRKTFKSTPKKQKMSKSAGVLKRLQKTEVSISHTVPSKKVKKGGLPAGRIGSAFGSQRIAEPVVMTLSDRGEVQVPATPAPRKRDGN